MTQDAIATLWVVRSRSVGFMANDALGLRKRDLVVVNLPRVYLPAARTMTGVAIVGGRNVTG